MCLEKEPSYVSDRGDNGMHEQCLDLLIKDACLWAKTHARLSWFLLGIKFFSLVASFISRHYSWLGRGRGPEGVIKDAYSSTTAFVITRFFRLCIMDIFKQAQSVVYIEPLWTHQPPSRLFTFCCFWLIFSSSSFFLWSVLKKILCSTSFHS